MGWLLTETPPLNVYEEKICRVYYTSFAVFGDSCRSCINRLAHLQPFGVVLEPHSHVGLALSWVGVGLVIGDAPNVMPLPGAAPCACVGCMVGAVGCTFGTDGIAVLMLGAGSSTEVAV